MDGGGSTGGALVADPSLGDVLLGGPRVPPSTSPLAFSFGGGGGGAATLIACRGVVSVTGTIAAGGGGGAGAVQPQLPVPQGGGHGGGAGGYVALQGLSINLTGKVFANGGGGSSGAAFPNTGLPGHDGLRSAIAAASGGPGANGTGAGGMGGWIGGAPGFGFHPNPAVSGAQPGGGGGSVGFFQSFTPAGVSAALAPTAASPAFRPGKQVNTR